MTIRDEVNHILKQKKLSESDFFSLPMHYYKKVEKQIEGHFVEEHQSLHWANMGHYEKELIYFAFQSQQPEEWVKKLPRFLYQPHDYYYFALEDRNGYRPKYWHYEGVLRALITVLSELPYLDYSIITKKMDLMISENHHVVVTFVGNNFKYAKTAAFFNGFK